MKIQPHLSTGGVDIDSYPLYELSLHNNDISFIMHELTGKEIRELTDDILDILELFEEDVI